MRRALVAAALGVAACNPVTPPGLDFDITPACDAITLDVRQSDVLPGWTIVDAAVERGGGDDTWYLGLDGDDRLWLRRVPEDIPALDLSAIGDPTAFQLVSGPVDGDVWLLFEAEGVVRLWRYSARSGALEASEILTGFHAGPWSRRLVFIGQDPYLLSYSHEGTRQRLALYLDEVTPELEIGTRWDVAAEVPCTALEGLGCMADAPRAVTLLDLVEPGRSAGAVVLFGQTTPSDLVPTEPQAPFPYETELVSVELRQGLSGRAPVITRRDHVVWTTGGAVQPDPGQVAADAITLYLLGGLSPGPDTPNTEATSKDYLLRAPLYVDEEGFSTETIELFTKPRASHLLQMGSRVALGQFREGSWLVAPIEADGVETELVGQLDAGGDPRVIAAGRSQFIVVGDGAPTRRVRIGCGS